MTHLRSNRADLLFSCGLLAFSLALAGCNRDQIKVQDVPKESDATPAPTLADASLGKQLYEVKYQCQSCHTIGGSGGYVGPNLNNAGGWLTPAWIEAWLKNPQALVPDSIEPRRNFTDEEIKALTAYLMTLRAGIKPQKTASIANSHAVGQGAGR